MRLMKLAGSNEMSVVIFSWAKLDTEEVRITLEPYGVRIYKQII